MLVITACGIKTAPWQENYDLGMRYLTDGNYEEAILAFTAAIEIDAKQPALYLKRAETYIKLADGIEDWKEVAEQYTKAFEDLKQVIVYGEPENKNGYQYYELEAGYGMAVYPNNFYYIGEWKNGQRSGYGTWICTEFSDMYLVDSYIYHGQWENDKPNGEGVIRICRRLDESNAGYQRTAQNDISGSFKNGYYHGTMYNVWLMEDGVRRKWTPAEAVDGVYMAMSNFPEEIKNWPDYQSRISQGMYVIALDENAGSAVPLYYSSAPNVVMGFE